MSDRRKVLIAVNGNKDVLMQGLKLAGSEQSMVTIVKVNPPYEGDLSLIGVKNIGQVLDGGSEKAVSEIKDIAESQGLTVNVRIEEGEVDKKIVEVAEEERCDLIIIGCGSQNGIKTFFFGNLLNEVTHRSPCPVIVVNSEKKAPASNFCHLHVCRENKERTKLAEPKARYY